MVELNRKLLLSLPKEWLLKVTTIEQAKDITPMTMEEMEMAFIKDPALLKDLVGFLISYEHTLQMDEEMENKKKKDLALKILMQGEEDDLDEKIAFITRNFR